MLHFPGWAQGSDVESTIQQQTLVLVTAGWAAERLEGAENQRLFFSFLYMLPYFCFHLFSFSFSDPLFCFSFSCPTCFLQKIFFSFLSVLKHHRQAVGICHPPPTYLCIFPSMLLAFAKTTAQVLAASGLFTYFYIWSCIQESKSQERTKELFVSRQTMKEKQYTFTDLQSQKTLFINFTFLSN